MASSEGVFPANDWNNFNESSIAMNRYDSKCGRHKNEITGRFVRNNSEASSNAQKFGEDRGPYIVEKKENLNKNRRPEAGYYLNYLLKENFVMNGPGENISVVKSFEEMNLNSRLMQNIQQRNYYEPLPIQRATFSLIQAGKLRRNWTCNNREWENGCIFNTTEYGWNAYPYCIVVSPTKELAEQLYEDTLAFSAGLNCVTVVSFGEIPRKNSIARIKEGCDIFICTVGRLCDYLQNKILELRCLHFLVFDEADRLLQMEGFYHDLVENLLPKCREIPNLRKMLFSATDYNDLAELKEEFLMPNATKVVVGAPNSVNPFIEQRVLKGMTIHHQKQLFLLIQNVLQQNLTAKLRREAIEALQSSDCHILVSTDVAARGLDIKGISHIINYEIPRPESFLSYVHRVGRTGRVGNIGRATTFFAQSVDHGMALILYRWLEMNKQEIPVFLLEEARRQINIEDLQKKTREEYERALYKSYVESSDGEI
uniref:RNA helicase n=1 Tax=Wuchereria bancrofti TaxID=6293 RepID=A0A1I8EFJ5_WUCBA